MMLGVLVTAIVTVNQWKGSMMKQQLTRGIIAGTSEIYISVRPPIVCGCDDCTKDKCHRLSDYRIRLSQIQANDLLSNANAAGETIMCEYNNERNVVQL